MKRKRNKEKWEALPWPDITKSHAAGLHIYPGLILLCMKSLYDTLYPPTEGEGEQDEV